MAGAGQIAAGMPGRRQTTGTERGEMPGYRVISSDSHVCEPPDLWLNRTEPKFEDRAPRVIREEGFDWWYCEGRRVVHMASGAQAGRRFEEPGELTRWDLWENVRPGAFRPDDHVRDMDTDGVDVNLLYSTVALFMYSVHSVPESELLSAIFRVYNDWIAEFCQAHPQRLKGIALLNMDDVSDGVRELERCAEKGLVGAVISTQPSEERSYDLPDYEPLWTAAENLDMPLSLHVATNRGMKQLFRAEVLGLSHLVNQDYWTRMCLSDIILSGVLERHPKLKVGAVESELGWAPHFLGRLDYAYTQRPTTPTRTSHRFNGEAIPSDFFRDNVFLSFQEDALGIQLRELIGVDNLTWGSDYPHQESTFPRSREILEEILAECTEPEKAKIAGGNAARIYRL